MKMNETETPGCPSCGSSQMKRILFSRFAIHGATPKSEGAFDDVGGMDDDFGGGMDDEDMGGYGGGPDGGFDDDDF